MIVVLFFAGTISSAGWATDPLQTFMSSYFSRDRSQWLNTASAEKFYNDSFSAKGACTKAGQNKIQSGYLEAAQRACLKIKNFKIVMDQMRRCNIDFGNDLEKKAFDELTWGLAQTNSESISLDCMQVRKSLLQQVTQLEKIAQEGAYTDTVNKTVAIAAKNAATAYYQASHEYESGDEKDPIKGLCQPDKTFGRDYNGQICGEFGSIIKKEFARLDKLNSYKVIPTDTIFARFDTSRSKMNSDLSQITVHADCTIGNGRTGGCDHFVHDWSYSHNTHYEHYKSYLNEFNHAVVQPGGMIWDSDAMQKEFGRFRTLDDMPEPPASSITGSYHFTKEQMHGHDQLRLPGTSCVHEGPCGEPLSQEKRKALVAQAVDDVKARIRGEMMDLAQMKQEGGNPLLPRDPLLVGTRAHPLERLIRTNPLAVGQLLIENPDRADLVCAAIRRLPQIKESEEKWKHIFLTGGVVVGIGTFIALPPAGGVTVASTFLGLGLGVVSSAPEIYYDYDKMNLERSIAANHMMGNNEDAESLRRKEKAELRFRAAIANLALKGIFIQPVSQALQDEIILRLETTESGTLFMQDLRELADLLSYLSIQKVEVVKKLMESFEDHPARSLQLMSKLGKGTCDFIIQGLERESLRAVDVEAALDACEGSANPSCVIQRIHYLEEIAHK